MHRRVSRVFPSAVTGLGTTRRGSTLVPTSGGFTKGFGCGAVFGTSATVFDFLVVVGAALLSACRHDLRCRGFDPCFRLGWTAGQ